MRSGSRHGCCGYQVISRSVKHVKAFCHYRITVADNVHDRGCTALLDTSAGFILKGGDTALLVTRARIIVNHLVMADKVILEAIDHVDRFVEYFFIDTAVH